MAKPSDIKGTTRTRRASEPPPGMEPQQTSAGAPSHDEIAKRAFELFLARGGAHGNHVEDWLRAEAELRRR